MLNSVALISVFVLLLVSLSRPDSEVCDVLTTTLLTFSDSVRNGVW